MQTFRSFFEALFPTAAATSSSSSLTVIPREFVPALSAAAPPSSPPPEFAIASYNILNQAFISAFHYPHCPAKFKELEYRHALLLVELDRLLALDAPAAPPLDVLAFQEVSPTYFATLAAALEERGYAGWFLKKSDSGVEGLATFYRGDRYDLADQREVLLNEVAQRLELPPDEDLRSLLLLHNTVAQFSVLRAKHSGLSVLVGNVHIHYDWTRNDLQALQVAQTLQELDKFSKEKGSLPTILCGDFNIQPTTPAYLLMRQGHWEEKDWRQGQNTGYLRGEERRFLAEMLQPKWFTHPVASLQSAYHTVLGSEPDFTNFTNNFVGCLDYILYSADALEALQVLKLPPAQAIKAFGGCPNQQCPSDHLAVAARFRFRDQPSS